MSSSSQRRRRGKPKPIHVTEAELAILKVLWDGGSRTARDIRAALYPHNTASNRATVQKLLERLESKELIDRDRSSFVHSFTARLSRDEFVGQQIDALADRLTDGSFVPLITNLVGKARLTAEELAELRKILNPKKA